MIRKSWRVGTLRSVALSPEWWRNEMTSNEPVKGAGCFQWSAGGWFGSQLGSTCWMLVGGVWLAVLAPLIGVIWLVCFAVANAVGTALWLRRDRLRPYPAIQILFLVIAICGLLAVGTFDVLRPASVRPDSTTENGRSLLGIMGQGDLRRAYLILLVGVPVGMVYAHLRERSAIARAHAQGRC
jgi:hypothetical protein